MRFYDWSYRSDISTCSVIVSYFDFKTNQSLWCQIKLCPRIAFWWQCLVSAICFKEFESLKVLWYKFTRIVDTYLQLCKFIVNINFRCISNLATSKVMIYIWPSRKLIYRVGSIPDLKPISVIIIIVFPYFDLFEFVELVRNYPIVIYDVTGKMSSQSLKFDWIRCRERWWCQSSDKHAVSLIDVIQWEKN